MLFSKKLLLTILMVSATSIYCTDYKQFFQDSYSHIKKAGQATIDNKWNLFGPSLCMFGGSYGLEFLSGRDSNLTIYDRLKASGCILVITAATKLFCNVIQVDQIKKLSNEVKEVIASPYTAAALGTGIYWLFSQK